MTAFASLSPLSHVTVAHQDSGAGAYPDKNPTTNCNGFTPCQGTCRPCLDAHDQAPVQSSLLPHHDPIAVVEIITIRPGPVAVRSGPVVKWVHDRNGGVGR
jgi:hypothetical protein